MREVRELRKNYDYMDPGSPEWMRVITPSKVAAIVGGSRWESPYGLWHRMKGLIDPEPHKDIFDTGHAFELALGYLWKLDNPGWRLSPGGVQYVSDEFGFPAVATLDRRASRGSSRRVVEFKTARSLEDWGDDFTGDCPGDYYTQVLYQMMVTGWTEHPAHLVVMGPFFRHHTYTIEFRPDLADQLIRVCQLFWESLASNTPPPLDDRKATYKAIKELHPDIERGSEIDVPRGLITELRAAREAKVDAETWLQGCNNRLLDLMGSTHYAKVGDVTVADRRPHGKGGVALVVNNKPLPSATARPEGRSA